MKDKFVLEKMDCKSCEILISDEIKDIKGVKSVKGDFKTSTIEIEHDGSPKPKDFEKVFKALKYKVKSHETI